MSPSQSWIQKMATMSLTDNYKTRHESKLRYRKEHMSSRPLPAVKQTNLPQIFSPSPFNCSSTPFNYSSTLFNDSSTPFDHSSTPFERSSTSLDRSSTSMKRSSTSIERSSTTFKRSSTFFDRSSTAFDSSWKEKLTTSRQYCAMESEVSDEHIGSKDDQKCQDGDMIEAAPSETKAAVRSDPSENNILDQPLYQYPRLQGIPAKPDQEQKESSPSQYAALWLGLDLGLLWPGPPVGGMLHTLARGKSPQLMSKGLTQDWQWGYSRLWAMTWEFTA
ncbi:hypothetical protein PG984_002474 [Apiospora sp. TS-2023a]